MVIKAFTFAVASWLYVCTCANPDFSNPDMALSQLHNLNSMATKFLTEVSEHSYGAEQSGKSRHRSETFLLELETGIQITWLLMFH